MMNKSTTIINGKDPKFYYGNCKLVSSSSTITVGNQCKHKTGWYGRVKFNIFLFELYKNVFACSDCGKILQDKELKDFRKKKA